MAKRRQSILVRPGRMRKRSEISQAGVELSPEFLREILFGKRRKGAFIKKHDPFIGIEIMGEPDSQGLKVKAKGLLRAGVFHADDKNRKRVLPA